MIVLAMNIAHNLYIHVPFCMSKCNYCAFYSVACANPNWSKYADNICSELRFWSEKIGKIKIPTIFFGGGTPSLMPVAVFERIMNCVNQCFDLDKDCEITLESNPGTINHDKLSGFISNGANRLSVGVQSLNDEELKFLGRKHDVKTAIALIESAMNMNLRVSADFIYGLPGQVAKDVVDLCNDINKLGLSHVSMYELTIEENTPFGKIKLNMPDNEEMARMYSVILETLSLSRYEVSNYATPGNECRHNLNIWNGAPYIGIGRGAAGRVYFDNTWYEQRGNGECFKAMSDNTRAIEKILTGMRTMRGVKLSADVKNELNFDWINSHKDLVELDSEYLHTTQNGLLILDDIIVDIIK